MAPWSGIEAADWSMNNLSREEIRVLRKMIRKYLKKKREKKRKKKEGQ